MGFSAAISSFSGLSADFMLKSLNKSKAAVTGGYNDAAHITLFASTG
ncbi:MAG: hypothetical protein QOH33_678, partial [Paraburkholderia sp.]|nr:hypothetical protein [Paraburkholderia sp.]